MSSDAEKAHKAKSRHKTSSGIQRKRFSGDALRQAVLEECRSQFQSLTGQPWSDDRALRIRRELDGASHDNKAEAQAYDIVRRLLGVLDEITKFTGVAPPDADGKFPRLPYVGGGYGVARFLLDWANKYHWRLVPTFDPIRDVVRRKPPEREDRITSYLARFGKRLWPRRRDASGALGPPPTPRELAIMSLLAGAPFPSAPERTTVADIMERQTKNLREAIRRAHEEAERLERSPEMQALAKATGIPPTALALLGAHRHFDSEPAVSKSGRTHAAEEPRQREAPDESDEGDTTD